jgi:hypothetical protein
MRQKRDAIRSLTSLVLAGALFGLVGCTGSNPPTAASPSPGFLVSYAAAVDRLTGSGSADAQDQVRDWALTALAAHLGLNAAQYRNASYDTLPVRDSAFTDLGRQATGPGREIYDGEGTLHLLVPQDDPHESRTIGLLLDQYRTDSGVDAPQTVVHHYRMDTGTRTVTITDGVVSPTADVRASNGYVTVALNSTNTLADFVSHTSYLSRLELRNGSEIWAGGWNWPATPDARVDLADVSVLQRGYSDKSGPTPGFSLDPQHVTTTADLLAVVPGLSQDLARRIIANDWAGSPFASAAALDAVVWNQLDAGNVPGPTLAQDGLPNDRTQLWALDAQLTGRSAYSEARYDGGIAGTAVGMTLEYTDYVAKNWSLGTGTGIPTKAVNGFLPDDKVPTPWSLCEPSTTVTGRLWFGENDSAVRIAPNGISIGAQATRLFARANSPTGGEVQVGYDLGRGLAWWDEHYLQVSDYEAEYQRLDQIMRWSEALDWLTDKTSVSLPRLPNSQIPSNLRFASWYSQHNELRERAPIHFVHPPSATQDALSHLPTVAYQNCGEREIQGGVSLGNLIEREKNQPGATLPPSTSRGGQFSTGSTFNDATGGGRTVVDLQDDTGKANGQLTHAITSQGNAFTVQTTGPGEPVDTFGGVKIVQADSTPRDVTLDTSVHNRQITEQVSLQDQDLGALTTTAWARVVTVRWQPGLMDRVRTVLESVQRRLGASPNGRASAGVPTGADGVLATYQTPDTTFYDVGGGPTDPWLAVGGTGNTPPPGSTTTFEVGGPDEPNGGVRFEMLGLVPHPRPPGSVFSALVPNTDHSVTIQAASAPDPGAGAIQVVTPDGKHTTVHEQNGQLLVRNDDPVFGVTGADYGAAMAGHLPEIVRARSAASKAKDNAMAAVLLGDTGVALVAPDWIYLAPSSDILYDRVALAERDNPNQTIWFSLNRGDPKPVPVLVGHPNIGTPTSTYQVDLGTVRQTPDALIYVAEVYRNSLAMGAGPLVTSSLPDNTKVTVRQYVLSGGSIGGPGGGAGGSGGGTGGSSSGIGGASIGGGGGNGPIDPNDPPDMFSSGGGGWWRLDGGPNEFFFGFVPVPPSTSPTPTPTAAPVPSAGDLELLLVCPANATGVAGCPS